MAINVSNITGNNTVKKYKKLYDIDIINNDFNSISEIQWYEYLFCTPNNTSMKRLPSYIYQDKEKIINIFRYVIGEKLGYKNRDEILQFNYSDVQQYKIHFRKLNSNAKFSNYEIVDISFPELKIKEWELPTTKNGFYNDGINRLKVIHWLFEKNNISLTNILNNDVNKQWFMDKGFVGLLFGTSIYELLINYCEVYHNIKVASGDFRLKPNGYYKVKVNADKELRKIVELYIEEDIITIENAHYILPNLFAYKYLQVSRMSEILIANYKHYKTYSFYNWIAELYPEFNLKESDFKINIGADTKTRLGSIEEKLIFDYIYTELDLEIKAIGSKKRENFKYRFTQDNGSIDVYYQPDFVVERLKGKLLNKPLIIEYYGMFREIPNNKVYGDYKEKIYRKNEYYKSNKHIYFIDIYPNDLKNKFEGVRRKLASFFMDNFNVDTNSFKEVSPICNLSIA